MPLFNENDYNNALDADKAPEGMMDLNYYFGVEGQLIAVLAASVNQPMVSPWMHCSLEDLPGLLGVEHPVEDGDELHSALVLGAVSVVLDLFGSIHEESVPGLLLHLASLHDEIDAAQEGEVALIDHWYLLSQLVECFEPGNEIDTRIAIMRITDLVYDADGDVFPEKALATSKYLMCIALAVLCADNEDCTIELLDLVRESHINRAAEPVVPYFDSIDDSEEEEEED